MQRSLKGLDSTAETAKRCQIIMLRKSHLKKFRKNYRTISHRNYNALLNAAAAATFSLFWWTPPACTNYESFYVAINVCEIITK